MSHATAPFVIAFAWSTTAAGPKQKSSPEMWRHILQQSDFNACIFAQTTVGLSALTVSGHSMGRCPYRPSDLSFGSRRSDRAMPHVNRSSFYCVSRLARIVASSANSNRDGASQRLIDPTHMFSNVSWRCRSGTCSSAHDLRSFPVCCERCMQYFRHEPLPLLKPFRSFVAVQS
jgi:hypothetical protein